jgi:hypothetical protein
MQQEAHKANGFLIAFLDAFDTYWSLFGAIVPGSLNDCA